MRRLLMLLGCISLVCVVLGSAQVATGEQVCEEGFRSLFNGQDLKGWDGDPKFWSVKDGAIVGKTTAENPTKGNTFLIWRDGEVDDFELRVSFKLTNHNSGIQYRSKEVEKWVIAGYQADFEDSGQYVGILYEERGRGILAQRGQQVQIKEGGKIEELGSVGDPAKILESFKKGEWNEYVIHAEGNRIIQSINGQATCEVVDDDVKGRALSGLLALQVHAGPPMEVQFKNVRLKRLPLKDQKKVVLVAGLPSHGNGDHEHPAGIHVLKSCLDQVPGVIATEYEGGWPSDPSALDNADGILFYMDGGAASPLIQGDHLSILDGLMKKGVGLALVHYAVEVPKDKGGKELKDWIGGYYETDYSINPHWDADFKEIPKHPVTQGVVPFKMKDEWYYCMRFRDGMKGVTPLLMNAPPDNTRTTEETKKHPGRPEVLCWAVEREDGGRGFGFTGGHFHTSWKDENFRRIILNAALWVSGAEVPEGGVKSTVSDEAYNLKLRK